MLTKCTRCFCHGRCDRLDRRKHSVDDDYIAALTVATMDLQSLMGQPHMSPMGVANGDVPQQDNAETVYISSLALLKMLKHGRAGVPMEVMGLLLGTIVDDYTVSVSYTHLTLPTILRV